MSSGNGINMYWNKVRKVTGQDMSESLLQGGEGEPGNKMSFSFNQENKGSMSMVSSASANQQLASITR